MLAHILILIWAKLGNGPNPHFNEGIGHFIYRERQKRELYVVVTIHYWLNHTGEGNLNKKLQEVLLNP